MGKREAVVRASVRSYRAPVCTENSVRIDLVTESPNVSDDGRAVEAPRYLIRDRDRAYGSAVTRRLGAMGIRDKPIAPGRHLRVEIRWSVLTTKALICLFSHKGALAAWCVPGTRLPADHQPFTWGPNTGRKEPNSRSRSVRRETACCYSITSSARAVRRRIVLSACTRRPSR
jgi:hypothetical protein